MKPLAQLWLSIAVLAPAVHAAEVELEIARPEPEWLLPAIGGPRQVHPEGVPLVEERSLLAELAPLVATGDDEAVLARVAQAYAVELALLGTGDREGFLRTRTPVAGPQQGPMVPAPDSWEIELGDQTQPGERGLRPAPDRSRLAERQDLGPGRARISASLLYVIGHSYFSLQQYRAAETAFELALVALPNHVRAHESLGVLLLRTERYADARVHLARAVQLGRNTAHVHSALGYLDLKTRSYWSAASAFERALALAPDDRNAQRGLLHSLGETREHAKARVLVEQLLKVEPDDVDLWRYRAQLALATDDRASALASLETALRLGDDSIENRRACVALHIESGNMARAVDLLRGSSLRGLAFPLVDQALGWLANEGDWAFFRELSASVDRTTLGEVEQSRLLTRRASLALRDGNAQAARAALQDALALDPSNADALMALGRLHRAERDYGRADLLFRRAGAYDATRDNASVARAELAIDQQDFDSALDLLAGVVTGNPARTDLHDNIAVLEDLVLLRTQR